MTISAIAPFRTRSEMFPVQELRRSQSSHSPFRPQRGAVRGNAQVARRRANVGLQNAEPQPAVDVGTVIAAFALPPEPRLGSQRSSRPQPLGWRRPAGRRTGGRGRREPGPSAPRSTRSWRATVRPQAAWPPRGRGEGALAFGTDRTCGRAGASRSSRAISRSISEGL
jgi:hypothetical protein